MIYLALHNSIESGAALFVNGEIVGAIHEERLTRVKNYRGFPDNSINFLLNEANLRLEDVDFFLYSMLHGVYPTENDWDRLLARVARGVKQNPEMSLKLLERIHSEIKWNQTALTDFFDNMDRLSVPRDKIKLLDHHECHAASAFYYSNFDAALVFTCDGKGGFKSNSVWQGSASDIKCLDWGTSFDSAGYFYGNMTKALGFKQERHEGKVVGLAAFGNPDTFYQVTNEILRFEAGSICAEWGAHYLPWFVDREDLPLLYEVVAEYSREDVCAATQRTLEEVVTQWIAHFCEKESGGVTVNVALAGGVFANVKLNQRIRELECVRSVYVHPAMGDGGLPLGALAIEANRNKQPIKKFLSSVYLGPKPSKDRIESKLSELGVKYTRVNSISKTLKYYFEKGIPVGFVRGRMEYGPRALCNRSILFHAKDISVNEWLNKALNRSEFMPFAPVTTEELAPACFLGWHSEDYSADFMTMTYDCTTMFKSSSPAAVHVDGTARPQVVRKQFAPELHQTLSEYFEMTGETSILNTSFNNHEEPIVCYVEDALNSLNLGNVEVVLFENFLVSR